MPLNTKKTVHPVLQQPVGSTSREFQCILSCGKMAGQKYIPSILPTDGKKGPL